MEPPGTRRRHPAGPQQRGDGRFPRVARCVSRTGHLVGCPSRTDGASAIDHPPPATVGPCKHWSASRSNGPANSSPSPTRDTSTSRRYDLFAELFTEDGHLNAGGPVDGREAIRRRMAQRPDRLRSRHVLTNIHVEVLDADHARGITYLSLYRHIGDESLGEGPIEFAGPAGVGHYEDEFVRTASGWRIARRVLRVRVSPRRRVSALLSGRRARAVASGRLSGFQASLIRTAAAPGPRAVRSRIRLLSALMIASARSRLRLLQLEHLLLDRVARDQPVGEHAARLADAVRAVDRLRLDRRVPPRVEQEDVVGRGQVQAQAAGLEADQEQPAVRVVLEPLDARLRGRASCRRGTRRRRRRSSSRVADDARAGW